MKTITKKEREDFNKAIRAVREVESALLALGSDNRQLIRDIMINERGGYGPFQLCTKIQQGIRIAKNRKIRGVA